MQKHPIPTTTKTLILNLLIVSWGLSSAMAVPADQSQTEYLTDNDWNNGTAQSFTAGYKGYIRGIRLLVRRKNGPRDLTVELKHVDENNRPSGPLLASGSLPGNLFVEGVLAWYTIDLTPPYEQVKGEELSFTIQSGPPDEVYGYLKFGQSTSNPYSGGLMYYSGSYGPSSWKYDEGHLDFAFQTLVTPNPEISIELTPPDCINLAISESHPECIYHVEKREDLVIGEWIGHTSTTGAQNELRWQIPKESGTSQMFYRINVEHIPLPEVPPPEEPPPEEPPK
jgi:hypothetical protein